MKNTSKLSNYGILLTVIAALFVGSVTQVKADYRHDDHGYWDDHHHHHSYEYYHHRRGYWDNHNGARIFINL